jgi:DNA repair protein RadD
MKQVFEDRPYQQEAIAAAIAAMESGKHALIQQPTGAGKAYEAAETSRRLIEKYGLKIAILVEQENLVRQLAQTVKDVTGIDPGIVCAGINKNPDWSKQITVGTRQTAVNHLHKTGKKHLLIADEAHRWKLQKTGEPASGQFAEIWSSLRSVNPDIKLLGFTATPYTLSHGWIFGKNNKDGFEPYFDELTYRTTYKELFDCGKLCLPELFVVDKDQQPNLDEVGLVGLEYNQGQLGRAMCRYVMAAKKAIDDYAGGAKHILVFCVNIEHVNEVVKVLPSAVPIHSKLPKAEADRNMSMFQSGMARCCVSVDQLSIGFDFKAADCAVLLRPSNSPGLIIQQAGRVLRIMDGKEKAVIIDVVGNLEKHLVNFDFDNPIVKVPRASKKTGDCPVKCCPGYHKNTDEKCSKTDLHAAVRVCPECGYEFTQESIEELMPSLKKVEMYAPKDPVRMSVESMDVWDHQGKKKFIDESTGEEYQKWMLVVEFQVGDIFYQQSVRLYLMFPDYYDGFAVDRSRDNWEMLSDDPFPDTVEEAVFLSANFKQPTEIEYQEKGGFKNVTEMFFEGYEPHSKEFLSCGDDVPF